MPYTSNEFHDVSVSVTRESSGHRLDIALAELTVFSRRRVRQAIADGGVFINRQRCLTAGRTVRLNDRLRIVCLEGEELIPFNREQIIWSHNSLILLNKKGGQYAQEALHRSRGTLPSELANHLGLKSIDVRPVHRLDHGTSGLILFSTDPSILQKIQDHWASSAYKRYLAVCEPAPSWESMRITLAIGKQRDKRGRYAVQDDGRFCDTEAKIIERRGNRALVQLIPHTGRTHQLRVHLAALGCPLLGDRRYGGLPHTRLMLHAHTLSLKPPAWTIATEWRVEPEEDWIW